MKFAFLASAIAFATVGQAEAAKQLAVTPQGNIETLFPDRPEIVVGELSSKCIDAHWSVTSSTSTEVICEIPMNFGQSLVGQMLLGNSYSTQPRRYFKFNVAEINGISRVQASGWMELQMAFGQTRRTDFSGADFANSADAFMLAAGGKYPLGTTFPNHVVMGLGGGLSQIGTAFGFGVTTVVPGSAADKAGVKVGDTVIAVAKKRFRNADQFLDAAAKATEAPTYEIENHA